MICVRPKAQANPPFVAPSRRYDFLPERWKILHDGLLQGGEIVSEYSNAWIDMRHDNALNSARPVGLGPPADRQSEMFLGIAAAAAVAPAW